MDFNLRVLDSICDQAFRIINSENSVLFSISFFFETFQLLRYLIFGAESLRKRRFSVTFVDRKIGFKLADSTAAECAAAD